MSTTGDDRSRREPISFAATLGYLPGKVVARKYAILGLLGEGGFGAVYHARVVGTDAEVALKLVRSDKTEARSVLARFEREARLAQKLDHPNTVKLLDFGHTEDGLPFMAWELLEGRDLRQILSEEGRLQVEQIASIAYQVLQSLADAHARGLVHRDIKPANIFIQFCKASGYPGGCWRQNIDCSTFIQCAKGWSACSRGNTTHCVGDHSICCGTDNPQFCKVPGFDGGCFSQSLDCSTLIPCGNSAGACQRGQTPHCAEDGHLRCCAPAIPVYCPSTGRCYRRGTNCSRARR